MELSGEVGVAEEQREDAPKDGAAAGRKREPWNSMRAFLTEILIVVIGVGLALAAQQVADWWRWQGEVQIARKALQEEIAVNNRFYDLRIGFASCADQQEAEARAILDRAASVGSPATFKVFHHGLGTLISDSEWQSQRASQVLTHFPQAELALMNRYYAQFPLTLGWLEEEGVIWSELSVLQDPNLRLNPDSLVRLRGKLDRVHRIEFLILLSAHRMLKLSDQLSLARPQRDPARMKAVCDLGDDKSEAQYLDAAKQR